MSPEDGARLWALWAPLCRFVSRRTAGGNESVAEDLAGETFARAVEHWPKLAEAHEKVLFGWLCTTALRLGIDRARHERVVPMLPLDDDAASRAFEVGSDRHVAVLDGRAALDRLGERDRAWLWDLFGHGYGTHEMMARHRRSVLAVKSRTFRARFAAKAALEAVG